MGHVSPNTIQGIMYQTERETDSQLLPKSNNLAEGLFKSSVLYVAMVFYLTISQIVL